MTTHDLFALMEGAVGYSHQYPDLRVGQALMNTLRDIDPETHSLIQNTQADPFYDDRHLSAFWAAL